jgi:hypothetical protein
MTYVLRVDVLINYTSFTRFQTTAKVLSFLQPGMAREEKKLLEDQAVSWGERVRATVDRPLTSALPAATCICAHWT